MAEIALDAGAAVELEDVLIALRNLLAIAIVIGLLAVVEGFVKSILWPLNFVVSSATFGLVGSVPGTHLVEQAISNLLASAVAALDRQVGAFWHGLKSLADQLASDVVATGAAIGELAWYVTHKFNLASIYTAIRALQGVTKGAVSLIAKVEHIATRAEAEVKSVAEGVYPRIRSIEHEIDHTIQPEITTTRELAQAAEAEVTNLWDYVKSNPWTAVTDAFVGAVAVALARLGLGGLRCPSFLNSLSSRGCGLFSGLESLLGWLVDALILTSLCDVLPLMEDAASSIAAPAVSLLTEAIDVLPCVSGNEPPALTVAALYLPPSPSLTLYVA